MEVSLKLNPTAQDGSPDMGIDSLFFLSTNSGGKNDKNPTVFVFVTAGGGVFDSNQGSLLGPKMDSVNSLNAELKLRFWRDSAVGRLGRK